MIRKSDVQWWVLEAKEHPESAPTIVEELARRLAELDAENERLRDEIARLQRRAPATAEGAEVSALRRRVATLQRALDGQASAEPAVVFLSDRLQSARMPLSRAQRLADEGSPVLGRQALLGRCCLLVLAHPHDELVLLTSQGRGLKVLLSDVPSLVEGGDWPAGEGQRLAAGERLTVAAAVAEPPRFWTVVTRRGYVRQFLRIDFDHRLAQREPLIESPFHNDGPVALVDGDRGDLLVLTRWGRGVRFPQRAIEGPGSVALELDPDDEVVAALPLPSDVQILIVTAAGYAARRDTGRFGARSRPGGAGKSLIQAFDVLGAFAGEPQARLLYLTYSGRLALVSTADIPLHQRSSRGTRVRDFGRDPAVAVAFIPEFSRLRKSSDRHS
jgi:DNA gyrase/topoisomerase IV subunit A